MEITLVMITAIAIIQPQTSATISDAYSRQARLNDIAQNFKARTFTEQQIKTLDALGVITKVVAEREVRLIWTFP